MYSSLFNFFRRAGNYTVDNIQEIFPYTCIIFLFFHVVSRPIETLLTVDQLIEAVYRRIHPAPEATLWLSLWWCHPMEGVVFWDSSSASQTSENPTTLGLDFLVVGEQFPITRFWEGPYGASRVQAGIIMQWEHSLWQQSELLLLNHLFQSCQCWLICCGILLCPQKPNYCLDLQLCICMQYLHHVCSDFVPHSMSV